LNDTKSRRVGLSATFRILIIGGLFGVAYDADHLLQPVLLGQWPTWDNLGGRILHIPLLVICGAVCIWRGALFAGLCVDTLVKRKNNNIR